MTNMLIACVLNKCSHVSELSLKSIRSVNDWSPLISFHSLKMLKMIRLSSLKYETFERILAANKLQSLQVNRCSGLGSGSIISIANMCSLNEVRLIMNNWPNYDLTPLAKLTNLKSLRVVAAMRVVSDFLRPVCQSIGGLESLVFNGVGGLQNAFFKDIHRLSLLKVLVLRPLQLPSEIGGITSHVFNYLCKLPSLKYITFALHIFKCNSMQDVDEYNVLCLNSISTLKQITIVMRKGDKEESATATRMVNVLRGNGKDLWVLSIESDHTHYTKYVLTRTLGAAS